MLIPKRNLLFHSKIFSSHNCSHPSLSLNSSSPLNTLIHHQSSSFNILYIKSIFGCWVWLRKGNQKVRKGSKHEEKKKKYTDPKLVNRASCRITEISVTIHSNPPVTLPGMSYFIVCNGVFVRLLIQKVKHVLDGKWQRTSSVGCAENSLKEIVDKLL